MSKIITIQTKTWFIDKSKEFKNYKYAIPEHKPILLSTGLWLHIYKVTKYDDYNIAGDIDIEEEQFNNNQL